MRKACTYPHSSDHTSEYSILTRTPVITYVSASTVLVEVAVSIRICTPGALLSLTADMNAADEKTGGLLTSVTSIDRGAEAIAPLAVAADTVSK